MREVLKQSRMSRTNFYYHMDRCLQTERENYERVARLHAHDVI